MVGREGLHREVLLDAFRDAGATRTQSHLATGNVSFDLEPDALDALTERVDAVLTGVVGRRIEVFGRTVPALRSIDAEAIYATAPFAPVRDRLVTFFHEPPELGIPVPSLVQRDRTAVLAVRGSDVFSATREHNGGVGAPGGLYERLSGQRMTTRAWSTIEKILARQPE